MGKKKTAAPRANESFADMVGKAQTNSLKPYIDQQMQVHSYLITQKIAKFMLDHISQVQTRQIALEKLLFEKLDLDRETLNNKITEEEDLALGLESITSETVEGDTVRILLRSKEEGGEYPADFDRIRVEKLLRKVEGKVQTLEPLEMELKGMKAGDTKEIRVEAEQEGEKPSMIDFKVVRVSRAPAVKEEGAKEAS